VGNPALADNVLFLHLDESPGAVAFADSSGWGNDAVSNDNPSAGQEGVLNSSIGFSGAGQHLRIANTPSLQATQAVTLSVWFKTEAFSGFRPLIYKGEGITDQRQYTLWLNGSGYLHLTSADVTGQEYLNTPSGAVIPGVWHHYVGVIDRPSGEMRAYLNGREIASGPIRSTVSVDSVSNLYLGATTEGGFTSFQGRMDEVGIFQRALSATEVLNLYRPWDDRGGGLMLENCGMTVSNSTIRGNRGRLGGGVYNATGALNLVNVLAAGNSASEGGGGLHNEYAAPILNQCTF
jgi:hypothetical protein